MEKLIKHLKARIPGNYSTIDQLIEKALQSSDLGLKFSAKLVAKDPRKRFVISNLAEGVKKEHIIQAVNGYYVSQGYQEINMYPKIKSFEKEDDRVFFSVAFFDKMSKGSMITLG